MYFFSFGADIFLSPTFSFPNLLLFPPPYIYTLLAVSCLYFIYSYVSFHRIEPVGGAYMGFIFCFLLWVFFALLVGLRGNFWDISIGI